MNTTQVYDTIWRDNKTSRYVSAVIPTGALPFIKPSLRECCYIVHIPWKQEESKAELSTVVKGSDLLLSFGRLVKGHWFVLVAVHFRFFIFDVLGRERMACNDEMISFIENSECLSVNEEVIDYQNCAYYCLLFAFHRSRGVSIPNIISLLKKCKNDVKEICMERFRNN